MRDTHGLGLFDWLAPAYVGNSAGLFMDWRRGEPNNHTVSEGQPTNGELCVQLVPWQEDPLVLEQGSWNDESCALLKPSICQLYGSTARHTLTVGTASLSDGALEGGNLVLGAGQSAISKFHISRAASVTITEQAAGSSVGTLTMADGASLVIAGNTTLLSGAYVGELVSSSSSAFPMQPVVSVLSRSTLSLLSACGMVGGACSALNNVTLNSRVTLLGGLLLGPGTVARLMQV